MTIDWITLFAYPSKRFRSARIRITAHSLFFAIVILVVTLS